VSAPLRFVAVVVLGWTGIRAMTLGAIPGFTVGYAKEPSRPMPPIAATQFPPLPPLELAPEQASPQLMLPPQSIQLPAMPAGYYGYSLYPAYSAAASTPIPPRAQWHLPAATTAFAQAEPADWQFATLPAFPAGQSRPVQPLAIAPPPKPKLDRLQLTSWALLRGAPQPGSLAAGGTLGGSQAGARLTYAFNRWLAASVRTTSPLGGSRGAEVAAGVRLTPFRSIPIGFTAERRQSISPDGGGRSAFALFAEGGVYRQPMPFRFSLDAYAQAGVVGFNSRDLFADGALAFTRPVWGRVSAGFGIWGGAQPGLYRIDAGPRISVRVRDNIYANAEWRQRIVGNARPSSGPALTLGADF
jgi:hypothetical protein